MRLRVVVVMAVIAAGTTAGCGVPPEPSVAVSTEPSPSVEGVEAVDDVVQALGAPVVDAAAADSPAVTVSRSPEPEPERGPDPDPAQESAPEPGGEPKSADPAPVPSDPDPPSATELACAAVNAQRAEYGAAAVTCAYSEALGDLVTETWSLSGDMGALSWRVLHVATDADIGTTVTSFDELGPALRNLGPDGQRVVGGAYSTLRLACKQGANGSTQGQTRWSCAFAMA
ncbi:hypothetical protein ACNI3K_12275 [Demequina sp. SO4-13]|uniref:hypothetical protein n=1 Tax=Demequina sp. SO4-13 TaxID=3401027 RepID=UPI003AF8F052